MNPMTLYTDQVIFRMQRMGGVSVYCEELLKRAIADEEIVVSCLGVDERIDNLAYEKIAGRCASFQPEKHDRLILQRIAQARIDDPAENAVFHGTYFRTAKNDDVRSVLTVHDFTHQKYFKGRQRTVNTVLKAKCIASCDSIICISENTKKDLFRYFPSAKEKVSPLLPQFLPHELRQT